jgi:DNA-binding winged helix-turn-helix (wHTH) protein/TolB-like protein/tetratricopeptide (TPR) repeat protein
MQPDPLEVLEFGPYRIDREQRLLTKGTSIVPLAPKVFDLLLVLAESGGRILTKESLLKTLWPDSFVEEGSLTRNISTLRKVLGESPEDQKYITTVPKRGYRFVAQVRAVPVSNQLAMGSGISAFSASDGNQGTIRASSDGQFPLTPQQQPAVVWWEQRGIDSSSPALSMASVASIAVKPLENTSGDASHDYFAEMITEALISELARIHKLKVFPSSVMLRHWSGGSALSNLAGELHLDMLVAGSVMRLSNQVRITVKAIHLPTQSEMWSHSYDRDLSEILAVQREVAFTIAAQVRADLTPDQRMQFSSARTVKPEAYDCYLRGRFYAQHQNKEDNETAMLALERAIAIDPTFALAYAELAQTYVWKLFLFAPHEKQWEEKAFVAVEKALSLDPYLGVAHLARGRLLWTPANHFPHVRAIREYRRALALNPSLDEARNQLALIYCHIGYFEDALRESQEAAFTNPNNNLAVYRRAQTFVFQGKHEEALAVLQTIPRDVNPSLIGYQTAWVLFNLGRNEEASAMIDQLLGDYPEDDGALFISMQAVLAASAGEERKAHERIELAIQTGKGFGHFHHAAYHIAIAFALMNNAEKAVEWLEFAAMDGFPCYPLFENDGNLENLRKSARYINFMAKLNRQWAGYQAMF